MIDNGASNKKCNLGQPRPTKIDKRPTQTIGLFGHRGLEKTMGLGTDVFSHNKNEREIAIFWFLKWVLHISLDNGILTKYQVFTEKFHA